MSAPYPTNNQNAPYPPYGPGASPYPPPSQDQWGQPGYQQPGYPPNVGFQMPPAPGFNPAYPPQPQPGYPSSQPGYPPQPGYAPQPSQPYYPPPPDQHGYDPSAKPMNPPYMDDGDPNYVKGIGFDDKSIRAGFIRRVYSILSIQLLVTLGFVLLFVYHNGVKQYTRRNPQLMIIPMVATIVLMCIIACCESARRNSPLNIILLGLFTLFESVMVGFISSTYDENIVLLAIGLTTGIVIGLTIFAFQTKYDFTMCGGFLCIMLMVLMVGSLIGAFFFKGGLMQFILSCGGAVIFSMYIVYDTQMMMGGDHKYSISPEEYIFAALNLYMDIIQLFIYLLRILKYLNQD